MLSCDISCRQTHGSRYSRLGEVKCVEDSLWKIWSNLVYLSRPYHFKFFKGCLPQILLGPFLNTLTHIFLHLTKVVIIEFIASENNQWFILYHQSMIAISQINVHKVLVSPEENVKCNVACMDIVPATFISPLKVFLCSKSLFLASTQPIFTFSPEQCVKSVQT